MPDQSPHAPPPAARCKDCRGTGKVSLLTSVQECAACAGTGYAGAVVYHEGTVVIELGPDGMPTGVKKGGIFRCVSVNGRLVSKELLTPKGGPPR